MTLPTAPLALHAQNEQMIDMMSANCLPHQFIREVVENARQAIESHLRTATEATFWFPKLGGAKSKGQLEFDTTVPSVFLRYKELPTAKTNDVVVVAFNLDDKTFELEGVVLWIDEMRNEIGVDLGLADGLEEFLQESAAFLWKRVHEREPNYKPEILIEAHGWHGKEPKPLSVPFKMTVSDNGCGMDREKLPERGNQLCSSDSHISEKDHFGWGLRITALPSNKLGLVFCSWQNGDGHMMRLAYDEPKKQYGMQPLEKDDEFDPYVIPIEDSMKAKNIEQHGTMVVFEGNHPNENTIRPTDPKTGKMTSAKYVTETLNNRYFKWPEKIGLSVREMIPTNPKKWPELPARKDGENDSQIRIVHGLGYFLNKHSKSSGRVPLTLDDGSKVTAHWWVSLSIPSLR